MSILIQPEMKHRTFATVRWARPTSDGIWDTESVAEVAYSLAVAWFCSAVAGGEEVTTFGDFTLKPMGDHDRIVVHIDYGGKYPAGEFVAFVDMDGIGG